jgi:hypothetical protein
MREMHLLMRLVEECPLREEGDNASKEAVEESLWPSLATRLVTLSSPRCDHFNGWIPAVTVAAVCLAMVLIASPPGMLAPQEAPQVSSTEEDAWPASDASRRSSSSRPMGTWNPPPIQTQPAFTPDRPDLSARDAIELMLESGSLPPIPIEPDGVIERSFERSNAWKLRLFRGTP